MHDWPREIQVGDQFHGNNNNVVEMGEELETMWNNPLVQISLAKHQV